MNRSLAVAAWCLALAAILSCHRGTRPGDGSPAVPPDSLSGDSAIAWLTGQINDHPGDAGLRHARALRYLEKKDFQQAHDDLVAAVQLDSTRPAYYLSLADVFFATGRTFEAKKSLEKCLELDPDNEDARSKLAEIYFIVRKYKEAMEHTRHLLGLHPANPRALFMQGMIFKETGDTVAAINSFQRALEADERFYNAYMQLGVIFTARENPVCLEYFDGALRVNPSSEEALYGKALWEQEHDKLDEAIRDYTSILQLNPKNKNAHFNLGYLHYTYLKVYDQAIKHYSDAIAVDPKYAEAYYNRGLCYEAVGDIRAAAEDYSQALALRPGYALALQGLDRVR
jgi:tetratricopeptide (TPR) repeat protein